MPRFRRTPEWFRAFNEFSDAYRLTYGEEASVNDIPKDATVQDVRQATRYLQQQRGRSKGLGRAAPRFWGGTIVSLAVVVLILFIVGTTVLDPLVQQYRADPSSIQTLPMLQGMPQEQRAMVLVAVIALAVLALYVIFGFVFDLLVPKTPPGYE